MALQRAMQTYTVLTIGDGLVTVIPALMISISGALIITRANSDSRMGQDFGQQVFGNPQPLFLAAGVLVAMAAFPGLPKIPFLILGGGVGFMAWNMRKNSAMAPDNAAKSALPAATRENVESLLKVEPLSVEVGLGLVKMVEGGVNSPLLKRIATIRRQLAGELGYVLPPVRVVDNLSLKAREYVISLKGVEISRYELPQGREMAISAAGSNQPVEGVATREPAFGMPALWIPPEQSEKARAAGYTVVDAVSVAGTHLGEIVKRYAHELFSRQDAKKLLDRVAEDNPKAVEDLVPKLLPLATVQKVLQNLLRERVSIRDAATILEALGEAAVVTKNPVLLTEYTRQAVRRMLVKPYLNPNGDLMAYFLDPFLEQAIESAVEHSESSSHLNLPPQRIRDVLEKVKQRCGSADSSAVLLASSGARFFLRQIAEPAIPNLAVLSHGEIPPGVKAVSLGVVQ